MAVTVGRMLARPARAALFPLSRTVTSQSSDVTSVGIIGYGVVGSELVDQVAKTVGGKGSLQVRGIADIDKMILRNSGINLLGDARSFLTMDPDAPPQDTDLDAFAKFVKQNSSQAVICDITASAYVAKQYPKWLKQGIHVVTPNKKAGSADMAVYREVKEAASDGGVEWRYECTVGAGLPIIKTAQDLVRTGDEVRRVVGIFSGTLSYIFNTMKGDMTFSQVVADAKAKGFTEPDPRDDLGGVDVQRKCVIMARECGLDLSMDDIPVESLVPEAMRNWEPPAGENLADAFIDALKPYDDEMAAKVKAAGDGVLRFVGTVDVVNKTAKVGLQAFSARHPFAGTQHSDNIILFDTKRYSPQPLVVQGPGAGAAVTAAGIYADMLDAVK